MATRYLFALAAFVKLRERIGAGDVEQPVLTNGTADVRENQGFRDQLAKAGNDVRGMGFVFGGDGDRRLQGEISGEHSEAPQCFPLGFR